MALKSTTFLLSFQLIFVVNAGLFGGECITVKPGAEAALTQASSKAREGDTLLLEKGVYRGNIILNPGTVIAAKNKLEAVIEGSGRGVVITMGPNSKVSGVIVRKGTLGILSSHADVEIAQCKIVNNSQSGVMCIGHLPSIIDNIIAYNGGSGIQGWDVRSTNASILHNTIAYNENHGINIDGNSDIIVENNIIAFNGQFAIKSEPTASQVDLVNNNFYQNTASSEALSANTLNVDPKFKDAQRLNFTLHKKSKCIGAGTDRQNLGARYFDGLE